METITCYIGLGSNLLNPQEQLQSALEAIKNIPSTSLDTTSSFYQTAPMGPANQKDYINAVAQLTTTLESIELLNALQTIENEHGRVRIGDRWGPRTLDLDMILYGNEVIDHPRLKVPHYGLEERNFVLIPLFEIAPELILPNGKKLQTLVESASKEGIKKLSD